MSPGIHRGQVLVAALLFSTGGVAIKATALTSWQVAGLRSGVAALGLALLIPAWRRVWRLDALVVGLAYAATLVLYVTANKLTTAANSIFLQSTAPIYVLLLGPRLLGERARPADLVFAAVLAAGLALFFVGSEPPNATAPDPITGNLLAAAAGVAWALTILGLRWLGRRSGPSDDPSGIAVVSGNLIAFVACAPWALPVVGAEPLDWAVIAYLGLFQIGLAYVFLTRGVRQLPAVEVSLLLLLEPVLSPIWAWWVHGEQSGAWSLAGCILIGVSTLGRSLWSDAGGAGSRAP
jgi:DME family drug/metabolite transporter